MTFFALRRLGQLAHRDHVGAALHELFDFQPNLAQVDVEVFQNVGRNAAPLLDQTQQHVLRADIFVIEALGFLIGQLHDLSGAVRESLVHGCSPLGFLFAPRQAPHRGHRRRRDDRHSFVRDRVPFAPLSCIVRTPGKWLTVLAV